MKAVKLALLTCQRKNYSFPNRQYNSLVSSCEDLGGVGTKSKYLMELTREIWKYLLHHGITITAEYLPGSMNMEAIGISNLPQVFQKICQMKRKPEMDLFASRLSA